jgi:SAM-dependent methyltransferase
MSVKLRVRAGTIIVRREMMPGSRYKIIFPESCRQLEQDEEYVIVDFAGQRETLRLHDYSRIYEIPGLYEEIFHRHLMCSSPQIIGDMLADSMASQGVSMKGCRVLDFGAGNGTVGERIREMGGEFIVGIDILPTAKAAAERDRPGLYDYYYVMDLTQIDSGQVKELIQYDFNTLITVGALGFGDIPPRAFLNALNLIQDDSWVAFNIRDRFISDGDDTGYRSALDQIMGKALSVCNTKRYCHRLSLGGGEISYIGIIGRKSQKR